MFEAWLIASQMERDGGPGFELGEPANTPLLQRYNEMAPAGEGGANRPAGAEEKHAAKVIQILGVIRRDFRDYEGVRFKATIERIELFSPDLSEQQF